MITNTIKDLRGVKAGSLSKIERASLEKEKKILDMYRELHRSEPTMSVHRVSKYIATKTNKSISGVKYTLDKYKLI